MKRKHAIPPPCIARDIARIESYWRVTLAPMKGTRHVA